MEKATVKHNRLRRMGKHDYTSACIYLITVSTVGRKRVLGTLVGDSAESAKIEPTALGEYVIEAFRNMATIVTEKTKSRIQVLQYQLMPDHFHGILYIREALPEGWNLSRMIAAWKGDCSREYWRQGNVGLTSDALDKGSAGLGSGEDGKENAGLTSSALDKENADLSGAPDVRLEKTPLFAPGFNDKILFHEGQLQTWYDYLHANPRRLWLKLHFPDRLRKVYDFNAGKKGHQYTAVGNTFLVAYPERLQVRCHRNLTAEQIQEEVALYLKEARRGTVLISPFISPAEKAVYEACYKEKLPMIRIVNRGLDGRFVYPTGRDLTGCSKGFLLVLAPYVDYSPETAETRITRAQCLDMNGFAADLANIATLTPGAHNENNSLR